MDCPLISIIINNYNYGRFINESIESALSQQYRNLEVIVVDDGSTDNSRQIISSFGDRIKSIYQDNAGQASAFNTGFRASRGHIVIFLDSDDILLPTAAEKAAEVLSDSGVSKVHYPLWQMDKDGKLNQKQFPGIELLEGDLLPLIVEKGPDGYTSSPTTGNAWSRNFLEKILPIPTASYKICADVYLFMLAPLFGTVKFLNEPQGYYRMHGNNNFFGNMMEERKLKLILETYDKSCTILKTFLDKLNIPFDSSGWKINSWIGKFVDSLANIKSQIPRGATFILVDETGFQMGEKFDGRT